jgi:hypothetical protein
VEEDDLETGELELGGHEDEDEDGADDGDLGDDGGSEEF